MSLPVNKIKILYVSNSFSGGIAAVVKSLLNYFDNEYFSSKYLLLKNKTDPSNVSSIVKNFFRLKKRYFEELDQSNIIHFHGAWQLHLLLPARYNVKIPILISLHGALHKISLKKSKFKKLIVKHLYMKKAIMRSTCIHALTQEEVQDIKDYGIQNVPIALIPNGIDMYECLKIDNKQRDKLLALANGKKIILSLSRLHPAKGIDMLIKAFAKMNKKNENSILLIVGDGRREYKNKLSKLIGKCDLKESVFMLGEMTGIAKNTVYEVADIFVLPSFNEGFGLTILEALRQNTPVIATNATPFNELEEHNCGWYIKPIVATLYDALECATNMKKNELKIMGRNGHAWIQKDYSLEVINKKYVALYLYLIGKKKEPDFLIKNNAENTLIRTNKDLL